MSTPISSSTDAEAMRQGPPPPPGCPVNDYDPYADPALLDPYPHYAELRGQGGVVYLSRYKLYALPRYETTRAALENPKVFSSARGVMLNDVMNTLMQGTLLCSDAPEHDVKREVIMRPLNVKALREIREEIANEADTLVDRLCESGSFDAATDLAEHLPLTIVSNRVGLPLVKRERMLSWAREAFDCIGPLDKPRTQAALDTVNEIPEWVRQNGARDKVAPGSWLDQLYAAAQAGDIPQEACAPMSIDYIGPSLDTTISALSNAMWLFAQFPDQWSTLRQTPSMIGNAINEIVRIESPIQGWTRYVAKPFTLDGVDLPEGSRVLVMFGSANRDERKWDDPERFDVTRPVSDHLGFGAGDHSCAGANLARLEISSILSALARRVRRFELVGEPERALNQITRGWRSIPMTVHLD